MLEFHRFVLFMTAAVVLAVTPGPGIFYVLTRTLAGGKREGVFSSLGTFVGGLVHVMAAGVGLSAILAASALAFAIVRYAGAAYLVYLGVAMIRSRDTSPQIVSDSHPARRNVFAQGVVTEVLNPKTALFFLSFIPQFVDPHHGAVLLQFVLLGSVSVALNTMADIVVVLMSAPLGRKLENSAVFRRRQRTVTGAAIIALGLYVAFGENH